MLTRGGSRGRLLSRLAFHMPCSYLFCLLFRLSSFVSLVFLVSFFIGFVINCFPFSLFLFFLLFVFPFILVNVKPCFPFSSFLLIIFFLCIDSSSFLLSFVSSFSLYSNFAPSVFLFTCFPFF